MGPLEILSEKIFRHFQNPKNRSYPLLLERDEIKEELVKLIKNSDSFYLLDKADDEIQGICGYYILEEEKYLQTTIFVSFNYNKEFVHKVLDHFIEAYPNYRLIIGLEADNSFLSDELKELGFKMIDDLYSASIKPNVFMNNVDSNIEEIDLVQWEDFKELHQHFCGEGYWTYDRIKDDFSGWKIYCIKEEYQTKAYAVIKVGSDDETCEVFGVFGDDLEDHIKLIEYSLASLRDKERMYYFIEGDDEMDACKELGFTIHGHYQAWEYKQ